MRVEFCARCHELLEYCPAWRRWTDLLLRALTSNHKSETSWQARAGEKTFRHAALRSCATYQRSSLRSCRRRFILTHPSSEPLKPPGRFAPSPRPQAPGASIGVTWCCTPGIGADPSPARARDRSRWRAVTEPRAVGVTRGRRRGSACGSHQASFPSAACRAASLLISSAQGGSGQDLPVTRSTLSA